MFRHWWFLRLLGDRAAAESQAADGRAPRAGRMTKEQQELVLHEWETLRERLRGFAAERVALVGDVMRAAEPQFPPELAAGRAGADYLWAAEAYQAAGKLLDEAADLPDLAAAVVLADRAVERLAAAHERLAGHRPRPAPTRCFYNPLHPPAAGHGPVGHGGKGPGGKNGGGKGATGSKKYAKKQGRQRLSPRAAAADRRPACEACRLAILAGQRPDVLPALLPVRRSWHRTGRVLVPYFTVPQQFSPWSATACGAYDDDAPALVLRGGHRRR